MARCHRGHVGFLLIDDASSDAGITVARQWVEEHQVDNVTLLRNPVNQGYGGNQKLGYRIGIDAGFDFIILLMLAMGLVAQMPAITYVLARMGLVTARWMLKVWRVAVIVILIVAAVLSPTNDVPNMLLFAAPMFVLYAISIIVAWICGQKRTTT